MGEGTDPGKTTAEMVGGPGEGKGVGPLLGLFRDCLLRNE